MAKMTKEQKAELARLKALDAQPEEPTEDEKHRAQYEECPHEYVVGLHKRLASLELARKAGK